MANLTQRLLYACRQAYQIVANDVPVPDAPNSGDIGWIGSPIGFVGGPDNIDAGLVGEIPEANVIAFRGTLPPTDPDFQTFLDWLNDLDALLVTDPHGLPGKVHQGFRDARDAIWAPIVQALAAKPAKPVLIVGHSKGGAVANLAAARLHKERPASQVAVCTFAAARSGDPQFAGAYNAAIGHSDRYEFQDDIVPHLPPSDAFYALIKRIPAVDRLIGHFNSGFESVGRLYFIDWSNKIVPDSALLEFQRFTHLAELVVELNFARIAADHSIAPGSGYADAPYA